MNEHESEPVKGLPDYLPDGETIVWQGEPAWQQVALRIFHIRKVAVYFLLLAAVHIGFQVNDGATVLLAVKGAAWLVILGAAAMVVLGVLARLYAKTTIYTITNERLVMRFGVALPMMINIPWNRVDAADMTTHSARHGSIALTLTPDHKASYWLLWPHAKPWHFSPVQPMLRCINDPQTVAGHIREVVAQQSETVVAPKRAATRPDDRVVNPAGSQTAVYS
jgi:hypothetical protein